MTTSTTAKTTLELFWLLAKTPKERVDASVKLIGALEAFQAQHQPLAENDDEVESSDDEDEDGEDEQANGDSGAKEGRGDRLDARNAPDVAYSIRRLVRGLASPRENARLGYSVALTELLSRITTVTSRQVLTLIVDTSRTQGTMSGQEERDALFARLFGLSALLHSGLLLRPSEQTEQSQPSQKDQKDLKTFEGWLTELVAVGTKKSWLRESAGWTILEAITALSIPPTSDDTTNIPSAEWTSQTRGVLLDHCLGSTTGGSSTSRAWTPEKVAVLLHCQERWPGYDLSSYTQGTWKHGSVLHASNFGTLAKILKESDSADDDAESSKTAKSSKLSTGAWKPQPHFVWDLILDRLLPTPGAATNVNTNVKSSSGSSKDLKIGSIQEFWRVVVDESLFSVTSSPERKYWGFQLFNKALSRTTQAAYSTQSAEVDATATTTTSVVPYLFTPNFMRTFINHLSAPDRTLHTLARSTASQIQSTVKTAPELGLALLAQLTGTNGSRQFDRLTKTKTIEGILAAMDARGIEAYVRHLLEQVNKATADEEATALQARRLWIIEQLSALVRNGSVPKNDLWVVDVLDFFSLHGLFTVTKKSEKSSFSHVRTLAKPAFSQEVQEACRAKLLACVADLTASTPGRQEGREKLADDAVNKNEKREKRAPGTASDGVLWMIKVLETISTLESDGKHIQPISRVSADKDNEASFTKARETLAHLKTVSAEQRTSAQGIELLLSGILLRQYCSGGCNQNEAADNEDSLDAVIEAASRLFPKPSSKSKKSRKPDTSAAVDAGEGMPPPVDVLVDVIIGFLEESTSYMRTVANQVFTLLSATVERSETVDLILTQLERRDPAQEDDEDEEMDDDEGGEDVEGDSDAAANDDDEDEDNTLGEDEDAAAFDDPELREKLEAAFGKKSTVDDEDDEEELMDDDQMMAIDAQLTDIFKSRKKETKASTTDAQRKATHFKNRVLDLVDIFLKTRSESPLVIRCMLPLVDLITATGTDEKQLADKASGILRSRFGKAREVLTLTTADVADALLTMEEIHSRARRASNQDVLATLSQCSVYLSRTLLVGSADSVLDVYRKSLGDFASRKASGLNGSFFHDFARRQAAQAWELRMDALDAAGQAVNAYRKVQVLQVIQTLLAQGSSIDGFDVQFLEFVPHLRERLISMLSSAAQDNSSNAAHVKDILKIASQAARQNKRLSEAETLVTLWTPDAWETLRSQLASSERFKSSTALHNSCKQIIEMTSLSSSASKTVSPGGNPTAIGSILDDLSTQDAKQVTKPKKRKAESGSEKQGDDEQEKTKRKKTKKAA